MSQTQVMQEQALVVVADTKPPRHSKAVTQKASKRWRKPQTYDDRRKKSTAAREPTLNEDGTVKKARKYKRSTLAKQRAHYYQAGPGAEGIKIRRSRTANWCRKLMGEKVQSMSGFLTAKGSEGEWRLWKSYIEPVRGALDKFLIEVLALAYAFAKERHSSTRYTDEKQQELLQDKKKRKRAAPVGIKLKKTDLRQAIQWYQHLARKD